MKSKACASDENMKTKGIGADSWALQCLSCLPLSHAWIGAQCPCVMKGDTHACNQRVFRTDWSVDLNKEWNEARSRTLMCDVVYLVRVGHLPHLKFLRQKSSCRLSLVSCLHRTSLFSTLWSRTGGGRMAKVDGCTGWEYKNHQQFPRGFCRVAFAGWLLHKVPLCHLKWSKTRDIRDIKASKASGHLLHLAAAEMQQSLSRHQGIAHRFWRGR